jgi:hypothetical protein
MSKNKHRCSKFGLNEYCCGTDIKAVRLRSRAAGGTSTNEFKGPIGFMCKECRKANCGSFKFLYKEVTDERRS